MPTHTIFNERPESQDRALKVLEKLGYTIVSRSDAEQKRGSRKSVLFDGIHMPDWKERKKILDQDVVHGL